MIKNIFLLTVLFFGLQFNGIAQDGKLNKAKESLKTSNSLSTTRTSNTRSSDSRNSRRSSRARRNRNNDFIFTEFFFRLFAYTTYGVLVETPMEYDGRMHVADISVFPYQDAEHGNFIYTDSLDTNYRVARLDVYNHFLLENKNLYGNDFGLEFRFLKRFSLEGNYLQFIEKVNGQTDYFTLYALMAKYHRIRTERFEAWYGIGATYIANDVMETGVTLGLGAELYFKKPISVAVSYKAAFIYNNRVNNTKVLLKYHIKNFRMSSGYQYFTLGDARIKTFSVGLEASF